MLISKKDFNTIDWDTTFNTFVSQENLAIRGDYKDCPNEILHDGNSKKTHFYWLTPPSDYDGFRSIWGRCLHTSCKAANKQHYRVLNNQWRKFLENNNQLEDKIVNEKEIMEWKAKCLEKVLAEGLEKKRNEQNIREIQSKITQNELPTPFEGPPELDWDLFLSLWQPKDIIFIGQIFNSAGHMYFANEKYVEDHLNESPTHTTALTFKGILAPRDKTNVLERKFYVLESDTLSQAAQWNLLMYIDKNITPLLMAVDTGGKSIHGWFKNIPWFEDNKKVLIGLGFDEALWRIPQPCRIPGVFREDKGKWQRIIYFNKNKHMTNNQDNQNTKETQLTIFATLADGGENPLCWCNRRRIYVY